MENRTFKQIETEAVRDAQVLKFRGASLPALYVPGAVAAPTKEQAIARALEETDPEVYARYRAEHNARVLVNTLRAAGIQIVPALIAGGDVEAGRCSFFASSREGGPEATPASHPPREG